MILQFHQRTRIGALHSRWQAATWPVDCFNFRRSCLKLWSNTALVGSALAARTNCSRNRPAGYTNLLCWSSSQTWCFQGLDALSIRVVQDVGKQLLIASFLFQQQFFILSQSVSVKCFSDDRICFGGLLAFWNATRQPLLIWRSGKQWRWNSGLFSVKNVRGSGASGCVLAFYLAERSLLQLRLQALCSTSSGDGQGHDDLPKSFLALDNLSFRLLLQLLLETGKDLRLRNFSIRPMRLTRQCWSAASSGQSEWFW